MPKYEVIVHNNDVGEGETNTNIQFWANADWVNIPSDKKVIISQTALENLRNSVQRKRRELSNGEFEEYDFTRFPVTVLRVIYSEEEKEQKLDIKNKKTDSVLLGNK